MFQLLGRMSVVMLLPSLAISAVTGLPVVTSVLIMGLLTTVYTAFGGFEAVIWTDFTQGVLMLFGMLLMIFMAVSGVPGGISECLSVGHEFQKFNMFIWNWDYTMPIIWIFGIQLLLQNLAFAADQPVVQRVYATPLKDMRKLAGMFAFCSIAIACLASFSGIAIFAYFHANPVMLDPGMTNDQVIPLYVVQRLPAGVAGLIIAALFAASMSTLSSSMNSVATVSCEDFYRRLFKHSDDKARLKFMKIASLVVGVLGTSAAAYMGTMNIRSMFETWNIMVALLGGGFIGIYILGMFTRRTNVIGALTGAIASIVVTLLVRSFSPLHWTFYGPVAVFTCLVVGYVVSILTGGNKKDLEGLTVFDMRHDLEE
jgi:SSS family transporter